jgi:hypothetical protein
MTLLDRTTVNPRQTKDSSSRSRPSSPLGGSYVTGAASVPDTEGAYVSTPASPTHFHRGTYVTTSSPSSPTMGGYTHSA